MSDQSAFDEQDWAVVTFTEAAAVELGINVVLFTTNISVVNDWITITETDENGPTVRAYPSRSVVRVQWPRKLSFTDVTS